MKIIAVILALVQSLMLFFGVDVGYAEKWKLQAPVYGGGVICETVYNTGSGLLSDKEGPADTDGRMQLVSETDRDEYEAYCKKLAAYGYSEIYSNELEGVVCNAFKKDGALYYTYYSEKLGEVRAIEDTCTKNFEDFAYTCGEGESVSLYQFDYPYSTLHWDKDEDPYSTNGMMYILRLADNSLVVIDGGSIKQSSDKNIEECIKFMHSITGTSDGETIRIALWYGTHGHSDHVTFFYKLLGLYHGELELERVMFNYPAHSLIEHDERINMFRNRLAKLYPDVKYLAPHTGMSFNIANLTFDVLYTHEDAVSAVTGKTPIDNANDSSTVCRLTAAGKTFLVLGDINVLAENKIVKLHGKDVFKTDVLQAPHHLYNSDPIVYANSKAQYVLCSMSYERASRGMLGLSSARLFYSRDELLFANDALYGIEMSRDGLSLSVGHTDCVEYDGSSMNTLK